jgi:hypothetical protein
MKNDHDFTTWPSERQILFMESTLWCFTKPLFAKDPSGETDGQKKTV